MKGLIIVFFSLLVLSILSGLLYKPVIKESQYLLNWSYCDDPVHYKEGSVDSRFKISQQAFLQDIKQAANIWDSAYNQPLFKYDAQAKLSVNLVYDERQAMDSQLNQIQNQVDNQKSSLNPQIQQYEADLTNFKQQLAQLNSQIDYWNQQGGAPPDVYTKLISEQASLQQQSEKLNQTAKELNQSTEKYNSEVDKLKNVANSFDALLQQKPEEGVYDPQQNRIEVYFANNQAELIHTLAHELGHARGMEHVKGTSSIMYPYTTASLVVSPQDMVQLKDVCQVRGPIEWLRNQVYQIIEKYNSQVQT